MQIDKTLVAVLLSVAIFSASGEEEHSTHTTDSEKANVVRLLKSSDRDSQLLAMFTAMQMGESAHECVDLLIPFLSSKDAVTKLAAIEALGQIGSKAKIAVPNLIKFLDEPDWKFRASAAKALGGIGRDAKDAVPVLLKLIQDLVKSDPVPTGDEWVLAAALNAIDDIGETHALVIELSKLLSDVEPRTRACACFVLGAKGAEAKASLPKIFKLLNDEDARVQEMARDALKAIEEDNPQKLIDIVNRMNWSEDSPSKGK